MKCCSSGLFFYWEWWEEGNKWGNHTGAAQTLMCSSLVAMWFYCCWMQKGQSKASLKWGINRRAHCSAQGESARQWSPNLFPSRSLFSPITDLISIKSTLAAAACPPPHTVRYTHTNRLWASCFWADFLHTCGNIGIPNKHESIQISATMQRSSRILSFIHSYQFPITNPGIKMVIKGVCIFF